MKYEDIKLVTYLEIAKTNNYLLLSIDGRGTQEECAVAWEKIVKRNGEVAGSFDFDNYKSSEETFGMLMADYNVIKAIILKLHMVVDKEDIQYLRSKGYKFNYKNSEEYAQCLEAARHRSDDIITKMKMKFNEIQEMTKTEEGVSEEVSIQQLIARLNFSLKFSITEGTDVTLAAYNEYKKLIDHGRIREKGSDIG